MNASTSTLQRLQRRRQNVAIEEEDATELKLGPEFAIHQLDHQGNDAPLITLSLSEARLLINAVLRQRRAEARENGLDVSNEVEDGDQDEEILSSTNEILRKTQDYLSVFARFKDEQTVSAVEHLLKSPENGDLHPFELAQLGSLSCEDADEAKTLIPSLADKKTDQELQSLLDHLRRFG